MFLCITLCTVRATRYLIAQGYSRIYDYRVSPEMGKYPVSLESRLRFTIFSLYNFCLPFDNVQHMKLNVHHSEMKRARGNENK